MSIQATHGNPAVQPVQSNHQPLAALRQQSSSSALPQDKVTISPEAKAKAASEPSENAGHSK